MRQSRLFTKTLRAAPKDEESANAQLLVRGGFIAKVMAGVYEYLPLGLKVLDKINAVIRDEMNGTGAEELFLSVLQSKDTWTATGRWESAKEVMYQFKDAAKHDVGLGWTHEEPITALARHFITSYQDLPRAVYQIQTKFRNEARAKSGLLRGREFLMKDLYSFHADEKDLNEYYEKVAAAYLSAFKRVGLEAHRTLASGGLFSKYSDEFQVLSDVGEDAVSFCEKCPFTANKDVAAEMVLDGKCPECGGAAREGQSIEVGNIFKLGTRFSEAFGLTFTDADGSKKPVIMASYGIGPGRVMGTIVETHHDERGIVWPESVAPAMVHLLRIGEAAPALTKFADKVYDDLVKAGVEVLYDDRDGTSSGEKFADADLIGIPWRAVVSAKTVAADKVELKRRSETGTTLVAPNNLKVMVGR
ncbi:MAG: aminoacyl--tRNA ligase-related protein [Candidatus Jorgensenbacteria bacterium]